jgi:quercetin dioxygenase-like cupin family protein
MDPEAYREFIMSSTMTDEHSEWLDVFGPKVRHLTHSSYNAGEYSVLLATMDPGVAVPLHRHADRETFYVLEGAVEGYKGDSWSNLGAGGILDIAPNELHAWRNSATSQAKMLIITTEKMASFFKEIGRPGVTTPTPPTPEELHMLLEAADRFGYWMASPSENEAVGLKMG